MVFVDDYLNFKGEYPESAYCRELDLLYRRAQRALGRYEGEETAKVTRKLDKEITHIVFHLWICFERVFNYASF